MDYQEVDMKSYVTRLSLVTVALILTAIIFGPSSARADEFDLKTFISVNQPIQVPGAVLQPNVKYVFRRLDSNAGTNHVVRVLNEDQSQVISTFFAAAAWRLQPEGDTVMTFYETASGFPKPVKTWYYPGRLDGFEFLYSKDEKAQIAAHMGGGAATVQTARETEPESFVTEPSAEETVTEETTVAEVQQPVQEEVTKSDTDADVEREKPAEPAIDESATPPVDESAPADMDTAADTEQPAERELPATAGELSLLALIGMAGLGLRTALKRV
jgi:hypothetical protein